jgi:hypothetical protein
VPHVIYCSFYDTNDSDSSYLAFYDYRAQAVRFHEHTGDPTSALAGFLRVVTGFLAVQGLISPSLHLDLLPGSPTRTLSEVPISDATPAFETLHESLSQMTGVAPSTPYDERLKARFRMEEPYSVLCRCVTGSDHQELPTAGVILQIQWDDTSKPMAAAFFYLTTPDMLACTDATNKDDTWIIEGETVDAYIKRILNDLNFLSKFNRPLRRAAISVLADAETLSEGKDPS